MKNTTVDYDVILEGLLEPLVAAHFELRVGVTTAANGTVHVLRKWDVRPWKTWDTPISICTVLIWESGSMSVYADGGVRFRTNLENPNSTGDLLNWIRRQTKKRAKEVIKNSDPKGEINC